MIRLLKLEYLKNFNYKPFKIFASLYFIVLIGLLFVGLVDFELGGQKINLKEQGIYNFPGIWNFTTYIVGLLKIFLGCIIVFSICQEFSNRMFKQNIIDGLSRKEFIVSKLLTITVFSTISTIMVFFIALYLGKTYSETQQSDLVFKEVYFVINYFVKIFTFFCFLMFMSVLFRKSIFVFLGFFMLWFVEGVVSGVEKLIIATKFTPEEQLKEMVGNRVYFSDFLPLESMSKLIPSPLMRTKIAELLGAQAKIEYPLGSLIACIVWAVVFIAGSYWILKRKDW